MDLQTAGTVMVAVLEALVVVVVVGAAVRDAVQIPVPAAEHTLQSAEAAGTRLVIEVVRIRPERENLPT
jgi:hypothetical protein